MVHYTPLSLIILAYGFAPLTPRTHSSRTPQLRRSHLYNITFMLSTMLQLLPHELNPQKYLVFTFARPKDPQNALRNLNGTQSQLHCDTYEAADKHFVISSTMNSHYSSLSYLSTWTMINRVPQRNLEHTSHLAITASFDDRTRKFDPRIVVLSSIRRALEHTRVTF
jgi:hypothetical protein